MLRRRVNAASGFTLLELMVTIGVFSILVALGVPSMKTWVYNVRVRGVADALQNGLRLAQTESLRRSRQVVFSLTNSTAPQTSLTAATNGIYWSINVIPALVGDFATVADFVEAGVLGSSTSLVQVTGQAEICFNSLGRLVIQPNTGVPGGSCSSLPPPPASGPPAWTYNVTLAGADRPLNVQVGLGGQVRMCDPNVTPSSTNPTAC